VNVELRYHAIISGNFPYESMFANLIFRNMQGQVVYTSMENLVNYDSLTIGKILSASLPVGTYNVEIRAFR